MWQLLCILYVSEADDLKEPVFTGACTAIITPFTENGIAYERLKAQLEFQIAGGVRAIVIAGTTGENATLKSHEFEKLVAFCLRCAAGRVRTIVGIGGNHTAECLEKAEFAQAAGADAVLMTAPYYNKTTQAGLIDHFRFVADRIELPMILYNVPGRTAIGIGFEAYRSLAEHPNINGVKEASGDFSLISRLASECGDLHLWSGNDDQTVAMMALGAKGVISVASNLIPAEIQSVCALCLAGQFGEAAALYRKYAVLCRRLFSETNPIPVKAAMAYAGRDSGLLRLPLVPISRENGAALRQELEALGLCGANGG